MGRNWLLAHWRRMAMQGALVGVLALSVGLAALVTHQKRQALRLPLAPETPVGRLRVSLPKNWSTPVVSDQPTSGDSVSVEETLPDNIPGRRLFIERVRTGRMMAPLEFLLREGYVPEASLTSSEPGESVARVQPLDVARWPGVMVTRAIGSSGSRRAQKQVLACATLPPGQAVVIRLEGPGVADAADEVLVRQMAETVRVRPRENDRGVIEPVSSVGDVVDLGSGTFAAVPEHFYLLPAELNRTARDLLADGSVGNWVSIELIPCLWFGGEQAGSDEQQLLTLLSSRDRDWRSGPVKSLGDGMWQVDRVESGQSFPSRAYCFTNGEDQALLAIMHGGWHSDRGFDAAWKGIYASLRFTSHKDLNQLLANGRDQAKRRREAGLDQLLKPPAAHQKWAVWDQSENADKQEWMQIDWGLTALGSPNAAAPAATTQPAGDDASEPTNLWHGSRQSYPDRLTIASHSLLGPYGPDHEAAEVVQQTWSGTADFSRYAVATDRYVSERGQTTQRAAVQRWELRDGTLRNLLSAEPGNPAPAQYVPGAWLPMVLSAATSGQPMLIKTESFVGSDGVSPAGLMTLYVAPVPDTPMPCVAVTVNGTGRVTRFWYATDGSLRYVDFAGNLRAQRNEAGVR
jgi:hypothetical protein